mmetsp:Transcript_98225/g.306380  ORF Transcript_98225/g.306380 Transcript_98225/m.306380 type:complete len:216 (-) Transcript_98225:576-1223(-)
MRAAHVHVAVEARKPPPLAAHVPQRQRAVPAAADGAEEPLADAEGGHRSAPVHHDGQTGQGGEVPEPHRGVFRTAQRAVRLKVGGHHRDSGLMADQRRGTTHCLDVPNAQPLVPGAADGALAARVHAERQDRAPMTSEAPVESPPLEVPNMQPAVAAAGHGPAHLRPHAHGHGVHWVVLVGLEDHQAGHGADVPQPRSAVLGAAEAPLLCEVGKH